MTTGRSAFNAFWSAGPISAGFSTRMPRAPMSMANLYANLLQLDRPAQLRQCFDMLTERSARLLNLKDYGFAPGHPADIVILDAKTPEQAIAEISRPVACFKNGRQTVRWHAPELLR